MIKARGFTLIELLVVVAIISLLSSIVFTSLNGARKKAHDNQIKQTLYQLRTAIELYASEHGGSYPSTAGEWWGESSAYGSHTLTGPNGWIPDLAPTYIKILPHDQYSGVDRSGLYANCPSTETGYFFRSDGKDYKIQAFCIAESFALLTDTFYDPSADYWDVPGFAIFTPGAVEW